MTLRNMMLAVIAVGVAGGLICVGRKVNGANAARIRSSDVQHTERGMASVADIAAGNLAPVTTGRVMKADVRSEQGGPDEARHAGKIALAIKLPAPQFAGTPKDLHSLNLEPDRGGKRRPPIVVPVGADRLLSCDAKVTSSAPVPVIGELSYITDGDKEHDSGTSVEINPGVQWVQIDLGAEKEISAACVWHYHGEGRIYFDVICQIANDPTFTEGVVTVFNNDDDNSAGLGAGADKEYIETNEGRPFAVNGVKGRYVRFYSKGNTSNEMNHYTEVEVYGKESSF